MPKWKAVAIINVLLLIAVVSLLTPAMRTSGAGAIRSTQAYAHLTTILHIGSRLVAKFF